MTTETPLKPCPFCQKNDKLSVSNECREDKLVTCQRCEASTWLDIWQGRAVEGTETKGETP